MPSSLAPLSRSVLSSAAATCLVVPFPCLRSCPTAQTSERRWPAIMIGTVVLALVSVAMARAGNATASPSDDEAHYTPVCPSYAVLSNFKEQI
ncbi:hypothetical protein HPB50_024251 [Hyalomma asiaticum]|uniref:Uncharacterized protein n=1 Tax=Hyalomma asiaticum TaxID=266040 RepID=A0ACB7SFA4_HYAAI|nr:hypothetical protein HPB50_024251 [Hyalomma asiaticum]